MKTTVELQDPVTPANKLVVESTDTKGRVSLSVGTATVVVDARELQAAAGKAAR